MDATANAVENYALFRTYRKDLLQEPGNSPPRLLEALQKADDRLKAARAVAREASRTRREQALREAEDEASNVVRWYDAQVPWWEELEELEQLAETRA